MKQLVPPDLPDRTVPPIVFHSTSKGASSRVLTRSIISEQSVSVDQTHQMVTIAHCHSAIYGQIRIAPGRGRGRVWCVCGCSALVARLLLPTACLPRRLDALEIYSSQSHIAVVHP
jgi:hypothetical protein